MKKTGLKLGILSAMLLAVGCADATVEAVDASAGDKCTANACKDDSTLLHCNNGIYAEVTCEHGCLDNECQSDPASSESDTCTVDTCIDSMMLSTCINGVSYPQACAYGCENGKCKPNSPDSSCVASVCEDNTTLLACVNGMQNAVSCPYGCEKGVCLQACTSDVCLNAGTLLKCTNGKTQSIVCEYGCEMGVCLSACTENFCRDNTTLMACIDGYSKAVTCPYGCNAGECVAENASPIQCSEDICGNEMVLYKCVNGQIQAELCSYGCVDGACRTTQCTVDACADETTLNVCVNGIVQPIVCPYGCDNAKCKSNTTPSTPTCTVSVCANDTMLNECINGSYVTKTCTYGCENGACKSNTTPTPECTTSVCANATTLKDCVNGSYVTKTCTYGCENGACKTNSSGNETPGDSCVVGSYVEKCVGELVYYCHSNVVTTLDCSEYASAGYACKVFDLSDGSTYADCMSSAESCTTVNTAETYCEPYSSYGNVEFEQTCVKSKTDNKNYWITTDMVQCATTTATYGGSCNADGTACADPSEGGTSDNYYDCTDEACTDSQTCGEYCASKGYQNQAWCDDMYAYCEKPNGGSSGSGPSVSQNSCNLSNLSAIEPFGSCSSSNDSCEVHVCWNDTQYDGYFTEYLVCLDLTEYGGDGYVWYPYDGIYMQCANQCAASGQACDSQGGEYGEYVSN